MAESDSIRSKTSYRKQVIILLSISVFLLLAILVSETAFDLNFLHPGNNQEIVVFAALSALIFLLFVALTFVLMRNLLKLFAERRLGVLGSKFRTRMVAGALLLSSLPVVVMYWFAYGLMNRSIDKWFSTPVEEVRADTHAMATLLAGYAMQNARAEAFSIAASPEIERAFSGHGFSGVVAEFQRHETTLQGGFALAVRDGNEEASFNAPAPWPVLKGTLPLSDAAAGRPAQFTWGPTDYTLGSAALDGGGLILVAIPLPREFSQTVHQVEASQKRYYDLARERRVVKGPVDRRLERGDQVVDRLVGIVPGQEDGHVDRVARARCRHVERELDVRDEAVCEDQRRRRAGEAELADRRVLLVVGDRLLGGAGQRGVAVVEDEVGSRGQEAGLALVRRAPIDLVGGGAGDGVPAQEDLAHRSDDGADLDRRVALARVGPGREAADQGGHDVVVSVGGQVAARLRLRLDEPGAAEPGADRNPDIAVERSRAGRRCERHRRR